MALQVIKDVNAYDEKGKPRFCPNFSILTYDTPDEESILALLAKTYGEGTLEKTEENRYVYSVGSTRYFVSVF